MREYNQKAASYIFKSKNASYPTDLSIIDLHGLFVNEALAKTAEHILVCRKRGVLQTSIITGKGLRSREGQAKIKPAVETFLSRESGLAVRVDPRNE
jgi:DNA-nicking Smr family endonuclease